MRPLGLLLFFFCCLITLDAMAAGHVTAPATETLHNTPDVTASLLKVIGGLLLVVLAIFGSAWFYRRYGNATSIHSDSLKVIGGVSMGQKERIVLMQVGEEQLLLAVSPGRIRTLHVLPKPISTQGATIGDEKKKFSEQLGAAVKQWKSS